MKTPYDKDYAKNNPHRCDWWDRYDALTPEGRELIMYDNVEPTPEILLVAAELTGTVFPEIPVKLNAKQRAWLKRQQMKKEQAKIRHERFLQRYGGYAQAIAPTTVWTKADILFFEEKRLQREEAERRKLHKVLGLTKKTKCKEVFLSND